MENTEQWVGECARCRDEKHLEYSRYGFAICLACELTIAASLQLVKKAFCRLCRQQFAWLWGTYEYDRGFICHGCTNGTNCQKCRTAAADKMIDSPIGPLWVCAADAGSVDEPPQPIMADRVY